MIVRFRMEGSLRFSSTKFLAMIKFLVLMLAVIRVFPGDGYMLVHRRISIRRGIGLRDSLMLLPTENVQMLSTSARDALDVMHGHTSSIPDAVTWITLIIVLYAVQWKLYKWASYW